MPFAAALSTAQDTEQALAETIWQVRTQLGNATPDLLCVFYTPGHESKATQIAEQIQLQLEPKVLLGCLGESVAANSREIENGPGLVLWGAKLKAGVQLDSFHLTSARTGDGPSLMGWPDSLFESDASDGVLLVFGDPYTFPAAELFLPQINEDYPGLAVVGGMASHPGGPGGNCLIRNGEVHATGAVGVLIRKTPWRSVVSQGCKPIGRPIVVSEGQDNLIIKLGNGAPLSYLQTLYEELNETDRELFQRGLLVGIAMSDQKNIPIRGDFLIRNLYAIDKNTGVIAITDRIRPGQMIQFHVRDAESADEELQDRLKFAIDGTGTPGGVLMFSCNGRGTRMFSKPNHDAELTSRMVNGNPLAGFFAAGEFGPVGTRNFVHGFTASYLFFDNS